MAGRFPFYTMAFGQEVEQNSSPQLYLTMGAGLIQIVSSRKTRLSHLVWIHVRNQTAASVEVLCCYFAPKQL